jgi:anti-sigma B factor antagonist
LDISDTPSGLALGGELDAHTTPLLERELGSLLASDTTDDLVIDMAAVDFVDSSGLRVLVEAHQKCVGGSRRLVLERPSRAMVRLLEVSGLSDVFVVVDQSVTDAAER